jgi:hypothetical protein
MALPKPRVQRKDRSAGRRDERRRNRLDRFGVCRFRADDGMLRTGCRRSDPPMESESHRECCAPARATEASHAERVGAFAWPAQDDLRHEELLESQAQGLRAIRARDSWRRTDRYTAAWLGQERSEEMRARCEKRTDDGENEDVESHEWKDACVEACRGSKRGEDQ